jgi:hypothetical protein
MSAARQTLQALDAEKLALETEIDATLSELEKVATWLLPWREI